MGVTADKFARKAIRTADGIVNISILLLVLLLVAFSGYALWDSQQLYQAADAARYEIYKPSVQDEGKSFGELQALNPEVFAWLTVYGTQIDYPVTQGPDNMKYVNTNAEGEYSLSGSIFLDSRNDQHFTDYNSIFYGHHMEKKTMFGELGLFSDQAYFDARRYGNLYYDGNDHGLEFFAFIHVDAYDWTVFTAGVQGEEEQQNYLAYLLEKAICTRDVRVTAENQIVLLSTCSSQSTNGRDILIGKITDELYEDAFKPNETGNTGLLEKIDKQMNQADLWKWVLLLLLAALILTGIVVYYKYRKRKQLVQNNRAENNRKE